MIVDCCRLVACCAASRVAVSTRVADHRAGAAAVLPPRNIRVTERRQRQQVSCSSLLLATYILNPIKPPCNLIQSPACARSPCISLHPPSVILHLVAAVLCGAQGGASAFDFSADKPFPVLVVNFDSHDAFPEETEFFGALCRRCKLQVRQLTKTCASHGALLQLLTAPPPLFSGHCRWPRHEV